MASPFSLLSGVATGFSMLSSIKAGKHAESAYEYRGFQERLAAGQQEIGRKRELLSAMASQNAARGAGGIAANSGSPAAMMRRDLDELEYANMVGDANLSGKLNLYRTEGKAAKEEGRNAAVTSLLNFAERTVKRGKA